MSNQKDLTQNSKMKMQQSLLWTPGLAQVPDPRAYIVYIECYATEISWTKYEESLIKAYRTKA